MPENFTGGIFAWIALLQWQTLSPHQSCAGRFRTRERRRRSMDDADDTRRL
jgi:hypothetical protein